MMAQPSDREPLLCWNDQGCLKVAGTIPLGFSGLPFLHRASSVTFTHVLHLQPRLGMAFVTC